jgi:hypothetical protein
MFIQTEATPNPATLKFLPGRTVLETGTLHMPNAVAAGREALRYPRRDRRVLRLRLHHRHQGRARLAASEAGDPRRHHGALHVRPAGDARRRLRWPPDGDEEFFDKADEEIVETIKELLDTRVRPAVAQDGGDITFRGYENGTVFLP